MNAKLCVVLLASTLQAQMKQPVDGFLDNRLSDLAVHGQRVVVRSPNGISWVDSISQPILQWKSLANISSYTEEYQIERDDIILNDSSMVVTLPADTNQYKWLTGNFKTNEFTVKTFTPTAALGKLVLDGLGGSERLGRFYLPVYDGGILVIESGEAIGIMIPDSAALLPLNFNYVAAVSEENRPRKLTTDDSTMTVLAAQNLFVWNFNTLQWTKRPLPSKHTWIGMSEVPGGVILSGIDSAGVSQQYRSDSLFTKLYSGATGAIRYGKSILYSLDTTGALTTRNAATGEVLESINQLKARIETADGFTGNYLVMDCGYTVSGTDTIFSVATTAGLLFSLNEHYDEENNTPFSYVRKDKVLAAGLSQTYAIPFIIRENDPAVISYNLGESAKVTIDILDYNLDFVCRIVESELRDPGTKNSSGQSTNRARDRWDGSLDGTGGSTAAAGVYYYRITTDKGERGFGKIILAKN